MKSTTYVLTDWTVMRTLTRAADRGVKVRIYLDGAQLAEREPRVTEVCADGVRLARKVG
jgi:phosphatidylserine/phosphatidylglycerophosphate/cardiolipin synthase-like enzyme